MKLWAMISITMTFIACTTPYEDQRKLSPHFREGKFHNPVAQAKSFWSFLKMRISTQYAQWPDWVDTNSGTVIQQRVEGPEIHVTHINHSTVLVQTAGLNILTDPIYSKRCSPVSWAGPKRVRNPGIAFDELPPIDLVLISHDHYDHLDLSTIEKLIERDQPTLLMGLGVGRHLRPYEKTHELDWWQSKTLENLKIHFVPVQHFSGRGLFDRNETLWGGFVIETPHKRIYFGGDTGYASHFQQTREKFGPMDLSLIPVGAYEPRGFMGYAHINPEEAVLAHKDLESKVSLGIHYGTFQLTAEKIDDPLQELKKAMVKHQVVEGSFITPQFGEVIKL